MGAEVARLWSSDAQLGRKGDGAPKVPWLGG